MTEVKIARRIGEPIFAVQREGKVVLSAVKSLTKDGYESFSDSFDTYAQFFDFDEAAVAAEKIIHQIIEAGECSINEAASLREYLSQLRTPEFRAEVLNQDLVEGRQLNGVIPAKVLGKEIIFPTDYFLPGQTVFGIITPKMHSSNPEWRPRPYFILKTMIEEVGFSNAWPGNVYYHLKDTAYRLNHENLFPTEKTARETLVKVFAEETGGNIALENIQVIPSLVEKKHRNEWHADFKTSRLSK
jgi:hypothetical protein